MLSPVEGILVDIVKQEMALADTSIWIANQNKKIPNDDGLYVTVGMIDGRVLANNKTTIPTSGGMSEIQKVVMLENIQIDILSKSNNAILRRYELLTSISSVYSQQQQEKFGFKIFKIPASFINASSAEGGSNLNRFSMVIPCHVWYNKMKAIPTINGDYYNDFTHRVDDAKSIETDTGIIEFEIPSL